jgi:non-ribosomal peptide synthetase component F
VATYFDCGALRLAPYPISQQAGQFDLTLEIAETGEQMNGALKYDTALFEDTTAARLLARFLQLLSASIENPDRRIADLPMPNECEGNRILSVDSNLESNALSVEPGLSESGSDEFVF